MRLVLALGLAACTMTACTLFTSLGDLDEGTVGADASPDGVQGTGTDAGSDTNVAGDSGGPGVPVDDASPDAGYVNLHPNGSMEFSCQGWYPYNATLESSPTARGGSASCMVCADKTVQDTATIDESGAVPGPVVGGVYVASGWFRVPDGKSPPSSGIKLVFSAMTTDFSTVEFQQTAAVALDGTWKKLSVQLTVTKPAAKLRIWAGGGAELGKCFLVDDIRVERWQ